MFTETPGIVLKQTKTVNGRRMLVLFTEKYGKISAGTSVNEKGRSKSSLATRPFTYCNYELYKGRNYYNLNSANVLKSFYGIGEDWDKYTNASAGLELCLRLLAEEQPAVDIFRMTVDFLAMMEARKSHYATLLLAYKIKLLSFLGYTPETESCLGCGKDHDLLKFSVSEGGALCADCAAERSPEGPQSLIYDVDSDILSVMHYILECPLSRFEKLALDDGMLNKIDSIIEGYIKYHLDPGDLVKEDHLR